MKASQRAQHELDAVLRGVDALADDPEIQAALEQARAIGTRGRSRAGTARLRYAMAASFMVAALGLGLWLSQPDAAVPARHYRTLHGEQRALTLPDGTRTILDSDSQAEYRADRAQRNFTVLQGRVHVDVSHDPQRPFRVMAGASTVTALGTVFDVELDRAGSTVTLARGVVSVDSVDATARPRGRLILQPGQRVHVAGDGSMSPVSDVDPYLTGGWSQGRLVFRDARLREVVDELNRYAWRPIILGDDDISELRIRATFRVNDVAGAVEMLTLGLPIVAESGPDSVVLRPARPGTGGG